MISFWLSLGIIYKANIYYHIILFNYSCRQRTFRSIIFRSVLLYYRISANTCDTCLKNQACFLPSLRNLTQKLQTATTSINALRYRIVTSNVVKIQSSYLSQPAAVCFLQHLAVLVSSILKPWKWHKNGCVKWTAFLKLKPVIFYHNTRITYDDQLMKMPRKLSVSGVVSLFTHVTDPHRTL